jgi:hypothetical protein
VGDDFARGPDVLRKQFVGERNHLDRAILSFLAEPFREADQGTRETAGNIVDRELSIRLPKSIER